MSKAGGPAKDPRVILAVSLLIIAGGLALIGLVDPRNQMHPWHALFGPKEDGNWAASSIDGRAVPQFEFRVAVLDRKVVGGRDGCNDWAYTNEPGSGGERMIDTTLQFCPDNERGRIMRVLAAASNIKLLAKDKLQISAPGHQAVFRRCRWKTVKESGPGWNSQVRRCLVQS